MHSRPNPGTSLREYVIISNRAWASGIQTAVNIRLPFANRTSWSYDILTSNSFVTPTSLTITNRSKPFQPEHQHCQHPCKPFSKFGLIWFSNTVTGFEIENVHPRDRPTNGPRSHAILSKHLGFCQNFLYHPYHHKFETNLETEFDFPILTVDLLTYSAPFDKISNNNPAPKAQFNIASYHTTSPISQILLRLRRSIRYFR